MKLKTAPMLLAWTATAVAMLGVTSALPSLSQANGGNRPKIEIGSGVQSSASTDDGIRGIIRVSYSGKEGGARLTANCGGDWRGCADEYYFAVSAQVGISSGGALTSMDVRVAPVQGLEYRVSGNGPDPSPRTADIVVEGATLPILATREVALGNEAKIRVDLVGVSVTALSHVAELNECFVNISANLLGFQYLRANGYGAGHEGESESFKGLDVGDAGVAVGATQNWSNGFRTRVTLGVRGELAAGKSDMRSWTTSAQSKEYARISAILETQRLQFEAYAQGSASQMAVGEESRSIVQLEFGALARF